MFDITFTTWQESMTICEVPGKVYVLDETLYRDENSSYIHQTHLVVYYVDILWNGFWTMGLDSHEIGYNEYIVRGGE